MKTTAAVIERKDAPFKLKTLTLGELGPHDVLVHIVASGICHTDEALRNGDAGAFPFPGVLGHEGAGIISEVGTDVLDYHVGDHVGLSWNSCGHCEQCLSGHPYSCEHYMELNVAGRRPDGSFEFTDESGNSLSNLFNQSSFSQDTIVPERNLIPVPKDVDLRYVGPLGCGFITGSGTVLERLQPKVGSSLVVFGPGAVGSAAIMAAKLAGCDPVIAVGIKDEELKMAQELGATAVINSRKVQDVTSEIKRLTMGHGADYLVDTTGYVPLIHQGVAAMAMEGTVAILAAGTQPIELDPINDLITKQVTVMGVSAGYTIPQTFVPKLIQYWQAGKYPFDKLIKFYPFDQINQANQDSREGKVVKPVLILDSSYVAPKD